MDCNNIVFGIIIIFFLAILIETVLSWGDLTANKIDLVEKYSGIYSNMGKYPSISSLENQLFKKEIKNSKNNEFLKDVSLMLVFLGLLTNAMVGFFSIIIENCSDDIKNINIDLLTINVKVLFMFLTLLGLYIGYLIIRKSLKIDAKKDAIIGLEKDCINKEITKRKVEEFIKGAKL